MRVSSLEQNEMEILKRKYRFTTKISDDQECSISTVDLLDESKCSGYLDGIGRIFQSSPLVTASQFSKRYSFLTIAPSLYAMTMFNKGMDSSAENSHVESFYQKGVWLPECRLTNCQVLNPSCDHRYEWRDKIIKAMFAENISKVWRTLSIVANIPKAILWENTAVIVYSLYEKKLIQEANEAQKSRIQEDYNYLLNEAPASLFGENENPLSKFDSPKQVNKLNMTVRIRKTCCFYYKVSSDSEYCITCPKVM